MIIADNITADAILGQDFLDAHKCVLDVGQRKLCVNYKTLNSIGTTLIFKQFNLGEGSSKTYKCHTSSK